MADEKKRIDGHGDAPAKGDGGGKVFDETYVRKLRNENAKWRKRLRGIKKQLREAQAKLEGVDMEKSGQPLQVGAGASVNAEGDFDKLRRKLI